jgi:hypothetical protein
MQGDDSPDEKPAVITFEAAKADLANLNCNSQHNSKQSSPVSLQESSSQDF